MAPSAILFCIVMVFLAFQQIARRLAAHPLVFLAFNLVFLELVMTVPALAWLAAFIAVNYGLAAAARRFPAAHPAVFVVPAVVMFAVFKKYDILPLQPLYAHISDILGLSYIIFRTLMIIFEARETGILPGVVAYLNFCLSMFTFLSGPIQRYRAFSEDMERRKHFRLDEKEGVTALTRLMNGVIKVIYLAPLAQNVQDWFMLARLQGQTLTDTHGTPTVLHGSFEMLGAMAVPFGFGLAALCYLVFLYFNFSGYTDMVIGLGRLLGFRLPENFNNPFAATNFLEFWQHWHITLSLWFRDYCFTPILKRMIKMGIKDSAVATLPAYFISFGLLGLWHGRTWPFIMCGLMFAVGSSVNHFWRSRMANNKRLRQLSRGSLYQSFASALTLFYISLTITGLWLSNDAFRKDWHAFTPCQAAISFTLIIAGLTDVLYFGRWLWRQETMQKSVIRPLQKFFNDETPFMIATKIFLFAVWYLTFSSNLPDFVYKGF